MSLIVFEQWALMVGQNTGAAAIERAREPLQDIHDLLWGDRRPLFGRRSLQAPLDFDRRAGHQRAVRAVVLLQHRYCPDMAVESASKPSTSDRHFPTL